MEPTANCTPSQIKPGEGRATGEELGISSQLVQMIYERRHVERER
jgi:hypothetical protein